MLRGCVREWRKEQGLLVMKGEEKEKDKKELVTVKDKYWTLIETED